MPELPEVQTVVDSLRPRLVGRRVVAARLKRTDVVRPEGFDLAGALRGRTARTVDRRGKRIIIALDDGNRLYIHLGMSGRLTLNEPEAAMARHTHLVVELCTRDGEEALQLRFVDPRRFGGIWWVGRDDPGSDIGPEPLGLSAKGLGHRLSHTRRAIKSALLDQAVVAGLGNIYVDESLFAAGVHPLRAACELTAEEIGRLSRAIKMTLRRAIRHRGSTLRDYVDGAGEAGGYQAMHKVYGREGEACVVCGSAIRRLVLGGRSTHFCWRCQRVSGPGR
jgi:formamidopyrimidine-DNA glycosylase